MKRKIVFLIIISILLSLASHAAQDYIPGFLVDQIMIEDFGENHTAGEGTKVQFWVKDGGLPGPDYRASYQWYFRPLDYGGDDFYALKDGGGISGSTSKNLNVTASALTEGDYYCQLHTTMVVDGGLADGGIVETSYMSLKVVNKRPPAPPLPDANPPGKVNPRVMASYDSI